MAYPTLRRFDRILEGFRINWKIRRNEYQKTGSGDDFPRDEEVEEDEEADIFNKFDSCDLPSRSINFLRKWFHFIVQLHPTRSRIQSFVDPTTQRLIVYSIWQLLEEKLPVLIESHYSISLITLALFFANLFTVPKPFPSTFIPTNLFLSPALSVCLPVPLNTHS